MRIDGVSSQHRVIMNTNSYPNATVVKPPGMESAVVHFRPDPLVTGNAQSLSGYQRGMGWKAQDLNILKDFTITLYDENNKEMVFGTETVALFLFEVSYETNPPVSVQHASRFRT